MEEKFLDAGVLVAENDALRQAEVALRMSEERFRNIYNKSPIAIELYDAEGGLIDANQACLALFGIESADAVKGFRLFDDPNIPPAKKNALRRGEAARYEAEFDFEVVRKLELYKTSRRGNIWLDVLITPIVAAPVSYLVQIVETTAHKRAEEELREERWRLQNIIEGTQIGTWEWNVQTNATKFNERWAQIVGYSLAELAPVSIKTWEMLTHPEDLARSNALLLRHFSGDSPYYEYECRMKHRDGRWVWVHDRGKVITWTQDGQPLLMFGTHADITERKLAEQEKAKLEEKLNHAEKMEAIGTLAGGVAHDFNNILGGMLGVLSLLEMDLGSKQEHIDEIKSLVQRGADVAKGLLGFGRRGKYDVRPLDLVRVAQETLTMFGRTRRDLTIETAFAPDIRAVLMDHAQLEQVLLNLLLNAGQAMPVGGRLSLRAENAILTANQIAPAKATPGNFVKFVVADTGVGMDEATRARIFEPFFTTKPPGKGSGLGLASVYGIVKNHGGIVGVESEPGKGSAFTIYLPATDLPAEQPGSSAAAPRIGHATVLLVDDDEHMLKSYARLLGALGYEVLTAGGGREAVDLVQLHRKRISIVVLDLTMPGMSGAKTFEAMREIEPGIKVLLSSGFSVDGQAQDLLARGCNGFIQKPFDIAALSTTLQGLL